MREIKFRAKCLSDGRLVYGAYHKHLPYTPAAIRSEPILEKDYQHCIIQDGFSDWNMPRGFEGFEVDPKTVGQLTGLKDKNGVEIYEGDIVKGSFVESQVPDAMWLTLSDKEKQQGFRLFVIEDIFEPYVTPMPDDIEVIGNIYDNQELLEDK